MTNAEVLDLIMSRLGRRTSPQLRALVLKELNLSIQELEQGPWKPWFMETIVSGTLTPSVATLATPTGFLEEVENGQFRLQNSEGDWEDLVKVPLERLQRETENEDPAQPEGYSIFGSNFYFGPTPDSAYPYKVACFIRTTAVPDDANAVTNPWLLEFFNYVALLTAIKTARTHIQSEEIARRLEGELGGAYQVFWRAVESRKHANADYLMTNEET